MSTKQEKEKEKQKQIETATQKKEEIFTKISNSINKFASKSFKIKEATYGQKRRQYFHGNDFQTFIEENKEFVCKEVNNFLEEKLEPTSENLPQEIFRMLHSQGICFKAIKKSDDKKKYPKKLYRFEEESADEDEALSECEENDVKGKNTTRKFKELDTSGYYILLLAEPKSQIYFYLIVIVIAIFAYCLLPVWPLQIKILIWWVSYIMLMLMFGLIIIRYSLHLFMLIFGKEFWLFPDLFNDHKGVVESFSPVYTLDNKEIDNYTMIKRMLLAVFLIYSSYSIYVEPTLIDDGFQHAKEAFFDMFTYVEDKIIQHHNGTQIQLIHNKDKIRDIFNSNEF